MKKKREFICQGLLFLILLGTLLWLQQNVKFLSRQYKTISGRLIEETITVKELKQAMEEEKQKNKNRFQEIVLWKQGGKREITNPDLRKKEKVQTTIVYGSMETAVPMELFQGSYVYKGDQYGCVIDTETAYKLFQNTNVVGSTIFCEKREYKIRGVVKTKNPVFIRQSEEEEKEKFNQLEFCFYHTPENGMQISRLFLNQYGKGEDAVFLDGILYQTVIQRFSSIPYWIGSACMLICIGIWYTKKTKKKLWHICLAGSILVIYFISLYCVIGNPFYIPLEWIPTKWSDFDFWTVRWKETKEHITAVRYLTPNTKDVLLMNTFYKSLLGIILSSLMMIEGVRRILKEE